ncbi:DUF948 domain-containing protein [Bacillus sp. 2205SS5-2]|uniref:DUF948 domain-containing protein n=1 Tax=Bacillus sp. 2205SS5-2 TaxID=3109031 RepID=UPI003004B578
MSSHNKKITIKINGEEKVNNENLPVHSWQQIKEETAATEDARKLSKDIEPSKKEQQRPNNKIHYMKGSQRPKRTLASYGSGWNRVVAPMIIAVVVGIFLGIVLLKIVKTEGESANIVSLQEQVTPVTNVSETETMTYTIKESSFQVLQGGFFTNEASAQQTADSLSQKGYPSALVLKDDQYYVLIGIAGQVSALSRLGDYYQVQNVEMFGKAFSLPESKIQVTNDEFQFLGEAEKIFNEMLAVLPLLEKNEDMSGALATLKNQTSSLESFSLQMPTIQSIQKETLAMVAALETYEATKKQVDYLALQQHLLNYYKLYVQLK